MTPRTAAEPAVSSLRQVAPLLWPAPTRVTTGRDGRSSGPAGYRYLVLPSADRPRRLVPLGSRRATAAAVWHGGGDARLRTRVTTGLLGGALACGLGARVLRDRWLVDGVPGTDEPGSIEGYLAGVLGRPVLLSLRLGPPRANLKPVIELLDGTGRGVAWAKVGINALTNDLVAGEHEVLQRLPRHPMAAVQAPVVQHLGQWRGCTVLVLSSLPRPGVRRTPSAPLVTTAMVEVARAGGVRPGTVATSPFADRLRDRLPVDPDSAPGTDVTRVLLRLLDDEGTRTLTLGRWHGDWHPGNMAAGAGRRLLLWDWERSCDGVPLGWDALHLRVQPALHRGRPVGEAVAALRADAPALLSPFGVAPADADLVVRLYLAELLSRYTADDQWTVPEVRPVAEGVLSVLSSWRSR